MKLNYKKIIILSVGFLALSFSWSLYNSYVPFFLKKFIHNNAIISFIMSLDSYSGLFIMPIFGVLSDRINTRMGRRIPFIFFGMIATATIISFIPRHWSVVSLIALVIGFNIVLASFRVPAVSLMGDMTPGTLRGSAYGIITLAGGIGALLAYLIGSYLFVINKAYPFYMASVLIIISLAVIYIFIKEKRDSVDYFDSSVKLSNNAEKESDIDVEYEREKNTSIFFLFASVFFLYCSYNAVETFFTVYGRYYLNIGEYSSANILTMFSLFMIVFSLPAGLIGDKFGKKRAIIFGLLITIIIFTVLFFSNSISLIKVLLCFSGVCWSLVYVNLYPLIISMTENYNVGRFTGYYYLFISLSAIISPIVLGLIMDSFGYNLFFVYTGACFIISLFFIVLARIESDCNKYQDKVQSDYTLT